MKKTFCDECGNEIASFENSVGSVRFVSSHTVNTKKYDVLVEIKPKEGGKISELCYHCRKKIIMELVVFK